MGHFKVKRLRNLVMVLLSLVSLDLVADDCEYAIKKANEDCHLHPFETDWRHECNKSEARVTKHCIQENDWADKYDGVRQLILSEIRSKAESNIDPAKVEVAALNGNLAVANSLLGKNASELSALKQDMADALLTLREEGSRIVRDYEQKVNSAITVITGTADIESMYEQSDRVSQANFQAIDQLTGQLRNIISIDERLKQQEISLLAALRSFTDISLFESGFGSLNAASEVVDGAVTWNFELQRHLVDTTKRVKSTIDQRIAVERVKIREDHLDALTKERLKSAAEISMSNQYLYSVQKNIEEMTDPRRSGYFRLPFLKEKIRYARLLRETTIFCDGMTEDTWHATGCIRARQFGSNAENILSSASWAAVKMGARLFSREKDAEVLDLNSELNRAIEEQDLDRAASVYDSILEILEV